MNNKIKFDGKHFTLFAADGSKRTYKYAGCTKKGAEKTDRYVLKTEKHSSGFETQYKFKTHSNWLGYSDRIEKIEQKDPTGELTFSQANFHYYDQSSDHPKERIKTSDGRQIEYKYGKLHHDKIEERYKKARIKKVRILKSTNTPENGLKSIKYRFRDKHKDPLISHLDQHQHCPVQVEYYTKGAVHLDDIEPDFTPEKIKSKSPLRGRVKHLKQPVGDDGSFQHTKTFTYHLFDPKSNDPKTHGWTNVYDAYKNLTTYRYTTKYRLYQKEVLAWFKNSIKWVTQDIALPRVI